MLKLFKRRSAAPQTSGAWDKLNEAIHRQQKRYSDLLQSKTAGWSKGRLILSLVAFCFLFGSSSIYAILSAFDEPTYSIEVSTITVPTTANASPAHKHDQVPPSITRMIKFKRYMDSLSSAPGGVRIHDSLNQARPGLLDSVEAAILLFETSKK
ncbi:hypothetical protein [Filimonas effusa]|uniref:Uncharacterized protein n=1 Tax=Filimonas effusa TaxID=2508721 RepID=A0A4Q1D2K5_9BACT|nr:hypothetical protein [Filimonas effusa]RXK81295.1 hypothetical protein ESB13_20375 [Filimonas effusa]